jgi:hypothetical protein
MGINDFFDRFRTAPTPEAEKRKTTMQLLEDENFLDFLDKVEAQSGTRVFAGLSLDEPATDQLMDWHSRYKDQQRVAEQVVGGVKQEFKEAGLTYNESLKLPSSKPYQDRFDEFFSPLPGELADAQAGLNPDLAQKLADAGIANAPDASGVHVGGTAGEDTAAEALQADFEARRGEIKLAQSEITRMKLESGLSPVAFADITDSNKVHTELGVIETKLSSFVLEPSITDPIKSEIISQRDSLLSTIATEKAAITPTAPARADLAKDLETAVAAADTAGPTDKLAEELKNLDTVDAALTEVYLAKETMGSRMDAIRAQVQEQAVSNPGAFDSLKEKMATLEAKDKEVQVLRKQMEQHGLDIDPDSNTKRLMNLRSSLQTVNKYGTQGGIFGTLYRMTSRQFRDAEKNLVTNHKMQAGRDRKSIQQDLASVESILASGTNLQSAKSSAESITAQIKSDIPAIDGLGGAISVALQESLKAKLAKGDLSGVDAARRQLENTSFATMINGEVDVDQMKLFIEDESRKVFQKNLLEQLEAKGGKNIGTILKGFENLAAKLQSTRSIESANLMTFIKDSLDAIAADLTLGPRTRQYAELIRNTVEARYS